MNPATGDIKNYNKERILKYIYEEGSVTRQSVVYRLHISLPTITRCLKELTEEGKIVCGEGAGSTGGRPAVVYRFNESYRYAVGVEVLADRLNIAVLDLKGATVKETSVEIGFVDSESYFSTYRSVLNRVIDSLHVQKSAILGITVSMQGILAPDGEHVLFGKLLKSKSFTKSRFQKDIPYPLFLFHDAEVAAIAELSKCPDVRHGIFVSLNSNTGSAIITDGKVVHTDSLSAGVLEHMVLHPDGDLCYCGKRGCADVYCSANTIRKASMENLDTFFENKNAGASMENMIWDRFLQDLSLFLDNARMAVGGDIIISGTLTRYMTEDDFSRIRAGIEKITAFAGLPYRIFRGYYGEKAALIGAGMIQVQESLRKEGLID